MNTVLKARVHQFDVRNQTLAGIESVDGMIASPTGSGKTTMAATILADLIASKKITHGIVIAPQGHIEDGFVDAFGTVQWPDGTTTEVGENVLRAARDMDDDSIARNILEYLNTRSPGYGIVCTHAALVVFNKAYADEAPKRLRKRILVVDEAHHYSSANELGAAVDNWSGRGGRLLFLTATPYRADKARVERPGMKTINYSLAEHMANGFAPRKLACCIVPFGNAGDRVTGAEFVGAKVTTDARTVRQIANRKVERWLLDGNPKTFVYVPPVRGGIQPVTKALIEAFRKAGARVLDATGTGAGRKKAFRGAMRDERVRTARSSQYDVIVGCKRITEGTDWKHCSAVYSIGIPGSLGFVVQMLGRAMRKKKKGTKHADIARLTFFVPCARGDALATLGIEHSRHVVMIAVFLADCQSRCEWLKFKSIRAGLGSKGAKASPRHNLDPQAYSEVKFAMQDRNKVPGEVELGDLIDAAHKARPDAPVSDLNHVALEIYNEDEKKGTDVVNAIRKAVRVHPELADDYVELINVVVDELRHNELGRSKSLEMLGHQTHVLTGGKMRELADRLAGATPWSEELIREKGEEWKAIHGCYPSQASGKIPGMDATWRMAHQWLYHRGSSLSKFFGPKFTTWSLELIRQLAEAYRIKHGRSPSADAGKIDGMEKTWSAARLWLLRYHGYGLADLLGRKAVARGTYTHEFIRERGEIHKTIVGVYPHENSETLPEVGVVWKSAYRSVRRSGSSLAEIFGHRPQTSWNEKLIKAKIVEFMEREGRRPTRNDAVPGTSTKFASVNYHLRQHHKMNFAHFRDSVLLTSPIPKPQLGRKKPAAVVASGGGRSATTKHRKKAG